MNTFFKILIILSFFIMFSGFSENTEDKVKNIIHKILETDVKNKFLEANVTTYSKGYYKLGKKTDKLIEKRISGKIIMKKPKKILFKVSESDDPMAVGSTLLYLGGKEIKIKPGGAFSFMRLNYNIDDPIFLNSRNHKFTFDGLGAVKHRDAKAELIGENEINHKKVYILKVVSPTKADPEITHEIYKIDAQSFVVLSIRMYVNNDMVSEYTIRDINNKLNDSEELFKL
ncbi:MAG: hypothetical protein U0457_07465 [Candidatus Sericytochromatia bacterium]